MCDPKAISSTSVFIFLATSCEFKTPAKSLPLYLIMNIEMFSNTHGSYLNANALWLFVTSGLTDHRVFYLCPSFRMRGDFAATVAKDEV